MQKRGNMSQQQSEEYEILFDNTFLQIRKTADGYTFMHESRCEGQIVAVLPYRKKEAPLRPFDPSTSSGHDKLRTPQAQVTASELEYLARLEVCPAHGREFELCSITGGKEADKSVEESAQLEISEEAGYAVSLEELISLGLVKPTKAADTRVFLFAVDVTGKEQQEAASDGTYFEQGSSVKWVDYDQAVKIEDPLIVTALVRFHAQR